MRTYRMQQFKNVLALILALLAVLAAAGVEQRKLPPDYEKKREAIGKLEAGVVPLYVLGDLNEDGAVDQEDLKLLRAYVAQKSTAGISCSASTVADRAASGALCVTITSVALSPCPFWRTVAMLTPCSANSCATAASTPGLSATSRLTW